MADEAEALAQVADIVAEAPKDMDVETLNTTDQVDGDAVANGGKRLREEADEPEEEENGGEEKKQKAEKSVEEERLDKSETADEEKGTETTLTGPVSVGPKSFGTSVEMFDYFFKFLHFWPPNFNVNKYEHLMLLDLLKKGHVEPEKKIGEGVHAFQVRFHPEWKSRCFFVVRENGSFEDFSFRKCVDHILPFARKHAIKAGGQ